MYFAHCLEMLHARGIALYSHCDRAVNPNPTQEATSNRPCTIPLLCIYILLMQSVCSFTHLPVYPSIGHPIKYPPPEVAGNFSVEALYSPSPIGIHGFDKDFLGERQMRRLLDDAKEHWPEHSETGQSPHL